VDHAAALVGRLVECTPAPAAASPAALRAAADGIYALEAATGLIVAHSAWLERNDFTSRFIKHGTTCDTPMAAIDWDAAITALQAGELPCSGGER
jgi:hypothetical protein